MVKATSVKKTCQVKRQNAALRVAPQSLSIRKDTSEEPRLRNLMVKLKEAVPSLQDKTPNSVSSLDIIQHAIFYIHDLWSALDSDESAITDKATNSSCTPRHTFPTEVY